jgi:tetratricopeptide (TPR) repeat protein
VRATVGISVGLLALAAGCAASPIQGPSAGAPAGIPNGDRAGAATGEGVLLPEPAAPSPVTTALLAQSHEQRDTGDLGGAAATIERALAIAPDAAVLWVELAELKLRDGDPDQAEAMAQKALTLTSPNSALAARARRLIRR